jgi:hypothetical protein
LASRFLAVFYSVTVFVSVNATYTYYFNAVTCFNYTVIIRHCCFTWKEAWWRLLSKHVTILKYSRVPIIWPSVIWHCFIRHAVSESSILSTVTVRDWILSRPHFLTLNNKGRQPLQTHDCSGAGMTLPQRKGRRRLRSKYPLLIS